MIRKLSVASIASTFTKRSSSTSSLGKSAGQHAATATFDQSKGTAPTASVHYEPANGSSIVLSTLVPDQMGSRDPSVASTDPELDDDVLKTLHYLEAIKVQAEGQEGEVPPAPPSSPSRSRSRLQRQDSRASTINAEERNTFSPPDTKPMPPRHQSRWAKVGALHRQAVAQVIRGLVG